MPAGAPYGSKNAKKWNLTERQKRFCQEYIINLNATQAAIRASYSKKTAKSIGQRLLTYVAIQEYISYMNSRISEKLEITHEKLTAEWAKMAFSSFDHIHNTWIERKQFEQIKKDNPEILDCIQEINTRVRKIKNIGNDEQELSQEIEEIKIKLYSKQTALENLGKHIGYYEIDNKQKKDILIPIKGITFSDDKD